MKKRLLPYLAAILGAPCALAGDIIVDPNLQGDAVTIREGLLLAQPGDTVIVYPGAYRESLDISKGVWIVPQQEGTVTVEGVVRIQNLPIDQQILLSGLEFSGSGDGWISIRNCDGVVHLDRSTFRSGTRDFPAASLFNARRVILTHTDLYGYDGSPYSYGGGSYGSPAINLVSSRATAWGGRFEGGNGSHDNGCSSGAERGHPGAYLYISQLFAAGTVFVGGEGGDDFCIFASSLGADGGDAIYSAGNSLTVLQGVTLQPGGAGEGHGGMASPGQPLTGTGSTRFLGGNPETHQADRFAFDGGTVGLTIHGNPGATPRMFLLTRGTPFLFDFYTPPGSLALGQSLPAGSFIGGAGTIGGSGSVTASVPIPALPSETIQAVFLASASSNHARSLFGAPMPVLGVNRATVGRDCDGNGLVDLFELATGSAVDANLDGRPDNCP